MIFKNSGLWDDGVELVKDAFAFSYKAIEKREHERALSKLTSAYNYNKGGELFFYGNAEGNGIITEDDLEDIKKQLEDEFEEQKKSIPNLMKTDVENDFKIKCLTPALELQNYSANPKPEAVAAALLLNVVDRDKLSFIEKKFGRVVASYIKEASFIKDISAENLEDLFFNDLKSTSDDFKLIYTANLISVLTYYKDEVIAFFKDQYDRDKKEYSLQAQANKNFLNQTQNIFYQYDAISKVDEKLNTRFLEVLGSCLSLANETKVENYLKKSSNGM